MFNVHLIQFVGLTVSLVKCYFTVYADIDPIHGTDDQVTFEDGTEVAEFLHDEISAHAPDDVDEPVASRLPCCAHTLQLVIHDALHQVPAVEKIIKDSSAVVGFFHRSLHWGCELKKQAEGVGLLAAVPTRWNSALIMLRRLVQEKVWRAVAEVLGKAKASKGAGNIPRFSATRSQIEDLVTILQPFEEATNSLQADGITISMVIPAILGIDRLLAISDTQFVTFKMQLRSALQRRFADVVCRKEYVLATLLDPRYKLMPFESRLGGSVRSQIHAELTPVQTLSVGEAKKLLLEQIRVIEQRDHSVLSERLPGSITSTRTPDASESTTTKKKSIFDVFFVMNAQGDNSEDSRYFAQPPNPETDASAYWSTEQLELPNLIEACQEV
jgi:hypothetical protein